MTNEQAKWAQDVLRDVLGGSVADAPPSLVAAVEARERLVTEYLRVRRNLRGYHGDYQAVMDEVRGRGWSLPGTDPAECASRETRESCSWGLAQMERYGLVGTEWYRAYAMRLEALL
jgi:hypothetical protein